MSFVTCVGQKETSRRPLCGTLRPNSNLVGEDHGIMRTCVSLPCCIETLRGYVSHSSSCVETLERHVSYHFLF